MKSRIFAIAMLFLVTAVPAAFAQKVKTDFDRSIDSTAYRTYAWKSCEADKNTAISLPTPWSKCRTSPPSDPTRQGWGALRDVPPSVGPRERLLDQ